MIRYRDKQFGKWRKSPGTKQGSKAKPRNQRPTGATIKQHVTQSTPLPKIPYAKPDGADDNEMRLDANKHLVLFFRNTQNAVGIHNSASLSVLGCGDLSWLATQPNRRHYTRGQQLNTIALHSLEGRNSHATSWPRQPCARHPRPKASERLANTRTQMQEKRWMKDLRASSVNRKLFYTTKLSI